MCKSRLGEQFTGFLDAWDCGWALVSGDLSNLRVTETLWFGHFAWYLSRFHMPFWCANIHVIVIVRHIIVLLLAYIHIYIYTTHEFLWWITFSLSKWNRWALGTLLHGVSSGTSTYDWLSAVSLLTFDGMQETWQCLKDGWGGDGLLYGWIIGCFSFVCARLRKTTMEPKDWPFVDETVLFSRLRSRSCDSSLCLCDCPCLDSTTKMYWSLSFSFTDLSWG